MFKMTIWYVEMYIYSECIISECETETDNFAVRLHLELRRLHLYFVDYTQNPIDYTLNLVRRTTYGRVLFKLFAI